jgi:hypothetical protein
VAHARQLDDGEAMALAIAQSRGWTLATDDRKAITVASSVGVITCGTSGLVKRWVDTAAVEEPEIRAALLRIKHRARYLPGLRDPLFSWWMGYLPDDFGILTSRRGKILFHDRTPTPAALSPAAPPQGDPNDA